VEPPPPLLGPFAHTEYRFTTGLRAGVSATIRNAAGEAVLSYRSFAGIVGVVAALVSAIVGLAGLAAVLFLLAESAPVRAVLVLLLTVAFTAFISLLTPRKNVTLHDDGQPALTIAQRSSFPAATWTVTAPNGVLLAVLRRSRLSRLGRNAWHILHEGRLIGEAAEHSFPAALLRKAFGKFSRRFETDVVVSHGRVETARILRRPDPAGRTDVLTIESDALDRRVLVALATLILGGEP
jgi:hypothetical protein